MKTLQAITLTALASLTSPTPAIADNPKNIATMRVAEFRFPSNGKTEAFRLATESLSYFRLDFTLVPTTVSPGDAKGFGWGDSAGNGGAFLIDNNCPIEMQVTGSTPVCQNEVIVAGKEYEFSIIFKPGRVALFRHWPGGTTRVGEFNAPYAPPFTLELFHQRTGVVYKDLVIKEQ